MLGKLSDYRRVEVQRLGDHTHRPIRQRHLFKAVRAKHFHVQEVRVAGVFEIMPEPFFT
jgi:hypothetical protein